MKKRTIKIGCGTYRVAPFDDMGELGKALNKFQAAFDKAGPDCCKSPDWGHAFAAMAARPPTGREKIIRDAVDAVEAAGAVIEEVIDTDEPTEQKLLAEAMLWDWIDGNVS